MGLTVSLTQTLESVERLARMLEDDLRNQLGGMPSAGADLWLSMEVPWGEADSNAQPELKRIRLTLSETAMEAIVHYTISPPGGKVRVPYLLLLCLPVAATDPTAGARSSPGPDSSTTSKHSTP